MHGLLFKGDKKINKTEQNGNGMTIQQKINTQSTDFKSYLNKMEKLQASVRKVHLQIAMTYGNG